MADIFGTQISAKERKKRNKNFNLWKRFPPCEPRTTGEAAIGSQRGNAHWHAELTKRRFVLQEILCASAIHQGSIPSFLFCRSVSEASRKGNSLGMARFEPENHFQPTHPRWHVTLGCKDLKHHPSRQVVTPCSTNFEIGCESMSVLFMLVSGETVPRRVLNITLAASAHSVEIIIISVRAEQPVSTQLVPHRQLLGASII